MDAENWLLPFPGSNPLEKKIIFVPMNVSGGSHSTLAVIVNAAAIHSGIAYANCNYGTGKVGKEFQKEVDTPVILYLWTQLENLIKARQLGIVKNWDLGWIVIGK